MAISSTNQFGLLLWKNWLLQKKRIVLTLVQILLPAILALILLLIRTRVDSKLYPDGQIWDSFEADAALPPSLILPRRGSSSNSTANTTRSFATDGISTNRPSGDSTTSTSRSLDFATDGISTGLPSDYSAASTSSSQDFATDGFSTNRPSGDSTSTSRSLDFATDGISTGLPSDDSTASTSSSQDFSTDGFSTGLPSDYSAASTLNFAANSSITVSPSGNFVTNRPTSSAPRNMPTTARPNTARTWLIAYAPNVTVVRRLMTTTVRLLNDATRTTNPNISVALGLGFQTEADLVYFFTNSSQSAFTTLCGLVFNSMLDQSIDNNSTVTYKIRFRAEGYGGTYTPQGTGNRTGWQTNAMYARQLKPGPQGDKYGGNSPGYYYEGFLAVQRAADMSIMNELTGGKLLSPNSSTDVSLSLKSFPYPAYVDDNFLFILTTQFPFIIMISFIVIAPSICKEVVLEKEKKLKESMKLMGMKAWLHWMSWFFKYAVFMLISVILMTFFFHLKIRGSAVINYTHWSITFVFLLLYTVSIITLCFAISTFFSKASAGAAAGGIIFIVTYIPFFFIGRSDTFPTLSAGTKAGCSILNNLAMGVGCFTLAAFESSGAGVQWSTINKTVSVDDNFTMLYTFLMLIFDIVLYSLITWYFDNLFPGDFGTPLPFYFPFTKWYWCGRSNDEIDADNCEAVDYGDRKNFCEDAPPTDRVGIKIRNLTKKFSQNLRPAVNKLNIDMYEGQITALLGHNGAGKSTTMFMLTGFLPPSSGTAYIRGYDLRTDLTKIRENLGLCPQQDVLFDTLTVEEHLIFFAKLKGCPFPNVRSEVDDMIRVLRLEDKRNVASSQLSGGMKRKLCVGIALIAGSKFVILDEPTSGMDPEARRQAWDILQSQRAGRTMILSTHFMDEADLLGDRIAIMADGQLQCYGSSLFLKGKYGIGYHLTIVKNPRCNVDSVQERIQKYVDEAQMESNVGAELSFILPRERSSQFEDLFTDLEQNRVELGIDSFGASVTTLEEVFIKVGANSDASLEKSLQNGTVNESSDFSSEVESTKSLDVSLKSANEVSYEPSTNGQNGETKSYRDELFGVRFRRVSGVERYLKQFYALLIKHAIHSRRNVKVTIVQIVLPVLFTIAACIVEKTVVGPSDPPPLSLNLSYFNKPIVAFSTFPDLENLSEQGQSLVASYQSAIQTWSTIADVRKMDMDKYLIGVAKDIYVYNRNYLIAGTLDFDETNITSKPSMTAYFNNIALHAIAMSLSVADNAILKLIAAQNGSPNIGPGSYIETINHPLPRSLQRQTSDAASTAAIVGFSFSYLVSFGMAFLVATFIVFVVSERAIKAKQAQFIAGVDATNFWLSTFLWDALCFMIPSILIIIVILAAQSTAYSTRALIGIVFFDLVLYGWSVIPFAYLLSFLFQVASTAYTWILVINIFTGTVAVLAVYILQLPALGTVEIGNGLEWLFYIFLPNFCFNKALQDMYSNYQYGTICSRVDAAINRTTFCGFIENGNFTNLCCDNACGNQCQITNNNQFLSWEKPGIGRSLFFMGLQGIVFFLVLFFLESNLVRRIFRVFTKRDSVAVQEVVTVGADGTQQVVQLSALGSLSEDDDVRAERERLNSTPNVDLLRTDKVILRELTKFYNGSFLAVDRLSVGIPDGECFGLLGVNGAGKTTTFKMMTGDEAISAGDASLDGFNVLREGQQARERVGYCPQFDALIDQMTVTETLWMYARMRGVVESDIKDLVEKLIEQLTLQKHAFKQAINLSGGNRRKLSTGIALIGNPSIVFLDEPTTGMDPVARRLLWNTLTAIRDSGRTLVLTSHSMEECEALCTRMAIMVNGRFQCLGSTQHLKTKFGEGYSLVIKIRQGGDTVAINTGETDLTTNNGRIVAGSDGERATLLEQLAMRTQRVVEFVKERFPGSQLKDQHDGLLNYRVVPDANAHQQQLSWSYVFGQIERAKVELDIEDYSVSQTTLEQIFINFARMQRPPQEVEQKGCCGCSCT